MLPDGGLIRNATSPRPLHALLTRDFPELVEQAAYYTYGQRKVRQAGNLRFLELSWLDVSPGFFEIFPLGSVSFDSYDSMALNTNALASVASGGTALGTFVEAEGKGLLKLTAIVSPFPENSTINGSAFTPLKPLENPESAEHWFQFSGFTYVRLKPGVLISDLLGLMAQRTDSWIQLQPGAPRPSSIIRFEAQRVDEVRFAKDLSGEVVQPGDIRLVRAGYVALAFLAVILLFNGISIVKVSSRKHSLEASLERLFGIGPLRMLGRSALWIGALSAGGITVGALVFTMTPLSLPRASMSAIDPHAGGVVLAIFVAIIGAHVCAAFFFRVRNSMCFIYSEDVSPGWFRGLAGIFLETSLAAGIALMAATSVAELLGLEIVDLGFDQDNLIVIRARQDGGFQDIAALKHALELEPGVAAAAAASTYPLSYQTAVGEAHLPELEGGKPVDLFAADGDLDRALGLHLKAGRFLGADRVADIVHDDRGSVVITEKLAHSLLRHAGPVDDVLGREIALPTGFALLRLRVVGVVADFQVGIGSSDRPAVIYDDPRERVLVLVRGNRELDGPEQLNLLASRIADEIMGEDRWDSVEPSRVWTDILGKAQSRMYLLTGGMLVSGFLLWVGLLAVFRIHLDGSIKEVGLRVLFGAPTWSALLRVTALISCGFATALGLGLFVGQFYLLDAAGLDAPEPFSHLATVLAGSGVLASALAVIYAGLRRKPPLAALQDGGGAATLRSRW